MEHDLAPERLPTPVRRTLARVDRLRDVWVEQQCNRAGVQRVPGRSAVLRAHARELLMLAGQEITAPGWRQRALRDENALLHMAATCHTGDQLGTTEEADLPATLADSAATALSKPDRQQLAEATTVATHPIVRAAHVYLTCAALLDPSTGAAAENTPPAHRQLPWAMATRTLLRSTYAPLAMDHRIADAHTAAAATTNERERLLAFVGIFCDLQTVAMRAELSHAPNNRPSATSLAHDSRPFLSTLHRCVLERARTRSAPFAMVLREIDSTARVDVEAGDTGVAPERGRCDAAAAQALFRSGPECRWVSLQVVTAEATLRLLLLVQDVGTPATGVLAVTADAWLTTADRSVDVLEQAPSDSVTLLPTDSLDDRRTEVESYVDDVVARAVGRLIHALTH